MHSSAAKVCVHNSARMGTTFITGTIKPSIPSKFRGSTTHHACQITVLLLLLLLLYFSICPRCSRTRDIIIPRNFTLLLILLIFMLLLLLIVYLIPRILGDLLLLYNKFLITPRIKWDTGMLSPSQSCSNQRCRICGKTNTYVSGL
jgi:hypothetical protein